MPSLRDADTQVAQIGVGDPEVAQGLAHVEVGLAGRDDADSVVGGVRDDPVEPLSRAYSWPAQPDGQLILLQLHEVGAQHHPAGNVRAGAQAAKVGDEHVRVDDCGGCAVGNVRGDLERGPESGGAAHQGGVHAEGEDVGTVGGVEDGDVEVGQGHFRRARDGGALGAGVVTDERHRPAARWVPTRFA